MGVTHTHRELRELRERARTLIREHLAAHPTTSFTAFELGRVLALGTTSARRSLAHLEAEKLVDVIRQPDPTNGYRVSTRYRFTGQDQGPRLPPGHHS
ncbi:hypothetical protein JOL79_11535 [Microbispora sp. RL4-1S]|uniref:Uncharacterized protein n=1 Tax=Microbispora oryzae TaxID=2806554 RepID=A0A940WFB8_9ACTN|nr:hypothetical protein [Microbispora oryzae]MBP2704446.1 hypothetical protein [Microbispora oryzae]